MCYTTIQAAVNAVASGGVVQAYQGTYKEQVTITQPVTVSGAGASSTIVDASGIADGHAFDIENTSKVTVKGFTAENAQLEGILVNLSSNVTLANNTVKDNDINVTSDPVTCPGALPFDSDDCGEGLKLQGATYSTVTNNIVEHNTGGILLSDETGPNYDNPITNNTVQDNIYDCGITLPSHPNGPPVSGVFPSYGVYNNTVLDNTVTGNGTSLPGGAGIGVFDPVPGTKAYDNTIQGNTVTGNGIGGVVLHSHAPGQNLNGNQILDNTISDNGALGDVDSGTHNVGVIIFAAGGAAPITGTVITGNQITQGTGTDVWVGTNGTSLTIQRNNLLGGSSVVGVDNAGTGTVVARANYWGCASGPGGAGCTTVVGTVPFIPVLTTPAPHR